jgi:hypothetical protein
MKIKSNKLVVVLGMHRSGTSAITRGLQVMGVALGDRMMPPSPSVNAKGFWEDIDLNALNIELLKAVDSDWQRLTAIDPIDVGVLRKHGYFLRAVELLRTKIHDIPVFGFKDPRVAKLLPFWKEVFTHCQLDVNFVVAIRNPLSVVKSLAKRDGIEPIQSYLLWLGHVIASLTGSAGSKRVLVDYDRLMQSTDDELNRMAKYLGLEVDPVESEQYSTEFLDGELRHTIYDLNDLMLDDACPPIVREVYGDLLDVASERKSFHCVELNKKIMRWSNEFERLRSSLLLVDRLVAQKVAIAHTVLEHEAQIVNQNSLSQTISERENQLASLNQAIVERDSHCAGLNQRVAALEGQIATLNQSVAERDDRCVILGQKLTETQAHIASLNQSIAEREGRILALTHQLDAEQNARNQSEQEGARRLQAVMEQKEQELRQLETTLRDKIAGLQTEVVVQTHANQLAAQGYAHEISTAKIEQNLALEARNFFGAKAFTEQQENNQLRQKLIELHLYLVRLQSSFAWQLLAPMRILGVFGAVPNNVRVIGDEALLSQRTSDPPRPHQPGIGNDKRFVEQTPGPKFGTYTIEFEGTAKDSTVSVASDVQKNTPPALVAPDLETLLQHEGKQFIEAVYLTLLKRAPDPGGLSAYLRNLDGGTRKLQIIREIFFSREGRDKGVDLPGLKAAFIQIDGLKQQQSPQPTFINEKLKNAIR